MGIPFHEIQRSQIEMSFFDVGRFLHGEFVLGNLTCEEKTKIEINFLFLLREESENQFHLQLKKFIQIQVH